VLLVWRSRVVLLLLVGMCIIVLVHENMDAGSLGNKLSSYLKVRYINGIIDVGVNYANIK
jgi:hypothetical protein